MPVTGPMGSCPRCGAEWHSALSLCTQCGALQAAPLESTVLGPAGFGAATGASPPAAVFATSRGASALAPAALAPAPGLAPAPALAPAPGFAPALVPEADPASWATPAPPVALPSTGAPPEQSVSLATPPPPAGREGKRQRRRARAQQAGAPPPVDLGLPLPGGAPAIPPPAPPWPRQGPPAAAPWPRHGPPAGTAPPFDLSARAGSAAKEPDAAPKLSTLAVVGLILSFACGPLGLVLSLIAFVLIKKSNGRLRGEWLAVLGVIVAVVFLMLWSTGKSRKPAKPRRAQVTLTRPLALTVFDDEHSGGTEDRWVTLGVGQSLLLVVVHTFRELSTEAVAVRIISARPATAHEKRQYEEGS